MKVLAAVIVSIFAIGNAGNASAEIHTDVINMELNSRKTTNIPPMSNAQKVFVVCRYCKPYEPSIKEKIKEAGYAVVEEEGNAVAKVVFSASIYVNKNGNAKRLDAEDITDEYAAQIPPVLDKRRHVMDSGAKRSMLDMDAGVIHQGSQLTGSGTGGIVIGLLGALVGGLIDQSVIDTKRVAGVADVFVEVAIPGSNYLLALNAAADTPETPDAIVRAAFARAVELLVSGVAPQPKPPTNGDTQW
ncbi:MAG: hypothetical protein Q8M09_11880 [Pseudomonadota bacterium]|nr:hypothetical protein [Pseudomonadota bacterium]MDP1904929.1 hypothetical protein [Pseudomonadota bacterium]MDP2352052.1 hypothetical protein [Pseudomonadota bacterium]